MVPNIENETLIISSTGLAASVEHVGVGKYALAVKMYGSLSEEHSLDFHQDVSDIVSPEDGSFLIYRTSTGKWEAEGPEVIDINVKVSANDTNTSYLNDKLITSTGINSNNALEKDIVNPSGDEQLRIRLDETKIDHNNLYNFSVDEHFTEASIDHSNIQNIGIHTHDQIDNHITSTGHLTFIQKNDLTDGGDSSLHYHNSDRNRSNHIGTQLKSTISDFSHASDHIKDGTDEIDGDIVDIDFTPSNYTPTSTGLAPNLDHLSAHLNGIDQELGFKTSTGHTHIESDITDLDHDAQKIKGVVVNDSAIADGKVLTYESSTGEIIYTNVVTTDEKVKASATDPTADYLDAKVDDVTIEVSAEKLRVKSGVFTSSGYVYQQFTDMGEPTGFVDRSESTLSFTDGTRKLAITPVGASFSYYIAGVKYTKSTAQEATITATEGLHFVYFNGATITSTTTWSDNLITENALVAIVYWDNTNNTGILISDERHGINMDGDTHSWFHDIIGAAWENGLALGNFSIDGNGNDNAHAQFSVSDGKFHDEDIEHVITDGSPQELSPTAQIPVFYKSGASGDWRKKTADNFPIIYDGAPASYNPTGGADRVPYNQWTGSTWQLTQLPANGNCVLVHYFATPSINHPIIGILGQEQYGSIALARIGATTELNSIITSGLPMVEACPIATVIFQSSTTYNNTPHARIRSTDTGNNYIDWRGSKYSQSVAPQTHDNLANLDFANSGHSGFQKETYQATSNPTSNNDSVDTASVGVSFRSGDFWENTSNPKKLFLCTDDTATAAVWVEIVDTSTGQTLANKTLIIPTIGDFTNATHDHSDDANGGTISHTDLTDKGTFTHDQIDTHITSTGHLTSTQKTDLTDGGDSSLHYHPADRNRANHTGTQTAATISDFDTGVSNNTDVAANTSARHNRQHALDSTNDHTGITGTSTGNFASFTSTGMLQDSGYDASDFANISHTHVESDITDLDHDAQKIKGVVVDDTNIADGLALTYNSSTGTIIYSSTGATGSNWNLENEIIVNPAESQITGKRYQTIASALSYIATQTPSISNRWSVRVCGTNSENFTVPSWVRIIGDGSTTRLAGQLSSNDIGSYIEEFIIESCVIEDLRLAGSNYVCLRHCELNGSTNTGGLIIIERSTVYGANFSNITAFIGKHTIFYAQSTITFPETTTCFIEMHQCIFDAGGTLTLKGGEFNNCTISVNVTMDGSAGYDYYLYVCSTQANLTIATGTSVTLEGGTYTGTGTLIVDGGTLTTKNIALNSVTVNSGTWNNLDKFIELGDTPASYSGQGSKYLRVNSGATAIEFVTSANDENAIHDNVSAEISAIAEKTTPAFTDLVIIENSSTGYAKNKLQLQNAGKAIKLDDLATPDNNTDLNATSSYHGLLPKLSNNSAQYLNGVGSWVDPFSIALPTPSNATAEGLIVTMTAGETLAFPNLVYLSSTGYVKKSDADDSSTLPVFGMALQSKNVSESILILKIGHVRYDTWDWSVDNGDANMLYVSSTGAVTQTRPTSHIHKVGHVISADYIWFEPEVSYTANGYSATLSHGGIVTLTHNKNISMPNIIAQYKENEYLRMAFNYSDEYRIEKNYTLLYNTALGTANANREECVGCCELSNGDVALVIATASNMYRFIYRWSGSDWTEQLSATEIGTNLVGTNIKMHPMGDEWVVVYNVGATAYFKIYNNAGTLQHEGSPSLDNSASGHTGLAIYSDNSGFILAYEGSGSDVYYAVFNSEGVEQSVALIEATDCYGLDVALMADNTAIFIWGAGTTSRLQMFDASTKTALSAVSSTIDMETGMSASCPIAIIPVEPDVFIFIAPSTTAMGMSRYYRITGSSPTKTVLHCGGSATSGGVSDRMMLCFDANSFGHTMYVVDIAGENGTVTLLGRGSVLRGGGADTYGFPGGVVEGDFDSRGVLCGLSNGGFFVIIRQASDNKPYILTLRARHCSIEVVDANSVKLTNWTGETLTDMKLKLIG